nr:hypothetical protein [Terriglobus sp. TAA 43]
MRILGFDPLDEFTQFRMMGDDRIRMSRPLPKRRFLKIKSESSLAIPRVGPVAAETIAGKDGLHIPVEIEVSPAIDSRMFRFALTAGQPGDQKAYH